MATSAATSGGRGQRSPQTLRASLHLRDEVRVGGEAQQGGGQEGPADQAPSLTEERALAVLAGVLELADDHEPLLRAGERDVEQSAVGVVEVRREQPDAPGRLIDDQVEDNDRRLSLP